MQPLEPLLRNAARYWTGITSANEKRRVIDILHSCNTVVRRARAGDVPNYVLQLFFVSILSRYLPQLSPSLIPFSLKSQLRLSSLDSAVLAQHQSSILRRR